MLPRTPHACVARRGLQLCALGLVVGLCALATAQPITGDDVPSNPAPSWQSALRSATDSYVEADYPTVVTLLAPHVDDEAIPAERRIRLLRLVSLAYVLQVPPDAANARVVMTKLLKVDPNFRYLEGLAPPEAIALLDDVRASLDLPGEGGGPDPDAEGETIYVQRDVKRRVRWAAFIPFGVGHFQNDLAGLGYAFAGLETAALLTNIATFLAVEGLRGPSGFYTREDRAVAQDLQTAQFWSLGALLVLMVADVVVANVMFVPEDVEIRTLDGPPPELSVRPGDPAPVATPSVTRFFLFRSDF